MRKYFIKYMSNKDVVGFVAALFVMPSVLNWLFDAKILPTTLIAFTTLVVYHFTADFFLWMWGWLNELWTWRRVQMKESRWLRFLEYGIALILVVILLLAIFDAAMTTPLKMSSIQESFDWDYIAAVIQALVCIVAALGILYLAFRKKEEAYEISAPIKLTQKRNHLHAHGKRLVFIIGLILFFGVLAILLLAAGAMLGSALMILWGTMIAAVLLIGLWFFGVLTKLLGALLAVIIGLGCLGFWYVGKDPVPQVPAIPPATATAPPAQAPIEEKVPTLVTKPVEKVGLSITGAKNGEGCLEMTKLLKLPQYQAWCEYETRARRCPVVWHDGIVMAPVVRKGDVWSLIVDGDGKPLRVTFTCKASK